MHIPVVSPSRLTSDRPEYVLLLAWNFQEEVLQQQTAYRRARREVHHAGAGSPDHLTMTIRRAESGDHGSEQRDRAGRSRLEWRAAGRRAMGRGASRQRLEQALCAAALKRAIRHGDRGGLGTPDGAIAAAAELLATAGRGGHPGALCGRDLSRPHRDSAGRAVRWAVSHQSAGAVRLTQAMLPLLRNSQGQVVFVNSTAGLKANANAAQYSATKHGLKALADSLREEENRNGVRVLSVFSGRTGTPMQRPSPNGRGNNSCRSICYSPRTSRPPCCTRSRCRGPRS